MNGIDRTVADIPPSPYEPGVRDALMSPIPSPPEDRTVFRLAQMLLLIDVATRSGRRIPTIDRLSYYEFLADSPFLAVDGQEHRDEGDRLTLELAGFTANQLSYASSGQRFASRRRRVQHDLAQLVAYGLVELRRDGYAVSADGAGLAAQFQSVYADAYRASSEIVLRRLANKSNRAVEDAVKTWLGESWLLIDLLDDVSESTAPASVQAVTHDQNDLRATPPDPGTREVNKDGPAIRAESNDDTEQR